MPNWCYTQYAIIGEKKELKELHDKTKTLQEKPEPLVPNGFGPNWLGCLVKALGHDIEKTNCRGSWTELALSEDGSKLTFNTETAWSRTEDVEDLIRKEYPSLRIYFLEDECGMGIFDTNDLTGEYFPERVIVDDFEEQEYCTEEEAFRKVAAITGEEVTDWPSAIGAVKRYNDRYDEKELRVIQAEII